MKSSFGLAVTAVSTALLLSACASSQFVNSEFPNIQVTGDLTVEDLRQITALARNQPSIRKPIYRINVRVLAARGAAEGQQETGDLATGFKVRKDNGRWKIIEAHVYQGKVVDDVIERPKV